MLSNVKREYYMHTILLRATLGFVFLQCYIFIPFRELATSKDDVTKIEKLFTFHKSQMLSPKCQRVICDF